MIFSEELKEDLWSGESAICFVVHGRACYWLIDKKYNICLDGEKEYRAYLDKGHITEEQFSNACNDFRNGILKLTFDNFGDYLSLDTVKKFTPRDFYTEVILDDELYIKVENRLVFGDHLSDKDCKLCNEFSVLLPLFYINFDRRIFMHMDWERNHESSVYDDWIGRSSDFSTLIPEKQKYWFYQGNDYWKFKSL